MNCVKLTVPTQTRSRSFRTQRTRKQEGKYMYPIFYIHQFPIPLYATFIIIGYIMGIITLLILTRKTEYSKIFVVLSSFVSAIGMFVGAKLMYCLSVLPDMINNPEYISMSLVEKMQNLFGGYVFYGGVAGAVAMICMLCFQFDYSIKDYCTYVIIVVPFIHGFGRIGCFMGGCCYGIKYTGPLHVCFPKDSIIEGLSDCPRFPVQLVEALLLFLLFLLILVLNRKLSCCPQKNRDTFIIRTYLICYPVIRFCLEFLRGDRTRGIFLGLSTSQWISLLILSVVIIDYLQNLFHSRYRH